jgi:hypothetical protein
MGYIWSLITQKWIWYKQLLQLSKLLNFLSCAWSAQQGWHNLPYVNCLIPTDFYQVVTQSKSLHTKTYVQIPISYQLIIYCSYLSEWTSSTWCSFTPHPWLLSCMALVCLIYTWGMYGTWPVTTQLVREINKVSCCIIAMLANFLSDLPDKDKGCPVSAVCFSPTYHTD